MTGTAPTDSPRILLHVQHLLGSGHQHRMAAIARSLSHQAAQVVYVSGGLPLPGLDIGGADFVQLSPARVAGADYTKLLDADGQAVNNAWQDARRDALLAAYHRARPHVVVTETYPFGRRLLRFELEPLLDAVSCARPAPRLVSSVRDLIEPRSGVGRYAEMAQIIVDHYDSVLVHTDPALLPFELTFPEVDRIADRIRYTGFVTPDRSQLPVQTALTRKGIVVSAGGGAVGDALLGAAVEAALNDPAHRPWRILAGSALAASRFDALRKRAAASVRVMVERNRQDFRSLLAAAQVSVSQAGYNTVVDLLVARPRSVLVPFAGGGEREQTLRAQALESAGLAHMLPESALNANSVLAAIDAALELTPQDLTNIDLNGADSSAAALMTIAREGPR